jgi:hypothetical protein
MYRRVFVDQRFRVISLVVAIMIVAWTVSFLFATIFECGRDLGLLWKSLTTFRKNRGKYKHIQLGHAGSDVITDFAVLALPLPSIWALKISGSRRCALAYIFLLDLLYDSKGNHADRVADPKHRSTAAGAARLTIVAKDIYSKRTSPQGTKLLNILLKHVIKLRRPVIVMSELSKRMPWFGHLWRLASEL